MVFPSLMLKIEPGAISQFSAILVIAFSYIISRFRKIAVFSLLLVVAVVITKTAFGFAGFPGQGGSASTYLRNTSYYGPPFQNSFPTYFYPSMPFQTYSGFNNWAYPMPQNSNCPMCDLMAAQTLNYPYAYIPRAW
jgi:hypothetical protein